MSDTAYFGLVDGIAQKNHKYFSALSGMIMIAPPFHRPLANAWTGFVKRKKTVFFTRAQVATDKKNDPELSWAVN